jgi:hypothetical protein
MASSPQRLRMRLTSTLGLMLVVAGCPSDEPAPATSLKQCNPLHGVQTEQELGRVVALGRAVDGTLFLVDEFQESTPRLFVSEGGALVWQVITAGGEGFDGGVTQISLTVDGDEPFKVLVELSGEDTRMLVVRGPAAFDRNLSISLAEGEALELVDESAIAGLRVLSPPGDVRLEYSANVESGMRLIVTIPNGELRFEDLRVFYGPPARLEERVVQDVERFRDGGSTRFTFEVGSELAEAFFPNHIVETGVIETEPTTLEIAGEARSIERLPLEAPQLEGLSFVCLP